MFEAGCNSLHATRAPTPLKATIRRAGKSDGQEEET